MFLVWRLTARAIDPIEESSKGDYDYNSFQLASSPSSRGDSGHRGRQDGE
jgi:hypothetical protein